MEKKINNRSLGTYMNNCSYLLAIGVSGRYLQFNNNINNGM